MKGGEKIAPKRIAFEFSMRTRRGRGAKRGAMREKRRWKCRWFRAGSRL